MKRCQRRFAALYCLWAAVLSTCLPVFAQPANPTDEISLNEAMSGRVFSLTIRLSDLVASPENWRQFSVPATQSSVYGVPDEFFRVAYGPYLLYFTQGQTFRSGGQTFLVAYRIAANKLDLARLMDQNRGVEGEDENGGARSDAAKRDNPFLLPPNTELAVNLFNTANVSVLNDMTRFDASKVVGLMTPAQEKAAAARQTEADVQGTGERSMSNLKQIGLGLIQYTQDYDELLPPMNGATKAQIETLTAKVKAASNAYNPGTEAYQTPRTVQERLYPYVKSTQIFLHPVTNAPYQPNASLSRRSVANIEDLSTIIAFYEAAPDANGKRAVLFLDGHVQRIKEKDWPQLRRASLVTIRLTGAAALYYTYKKRETAPRDAGANGPLYVSQSTGRVYYRIMSGPEKGQFRWAAPPTDSIEVPYETGQYLGLSKYQGYNGAQKGKSFGGYGTGKTYRDAAPVAP